MSVPPQWVVSVIRAGVIAPITVYQRLISPAIPRRCKYEPTCSRYAVDAIKRYGILRGLVLAGWRLLRCNPFSYGGYDPVEAQRVFAIRPDEPAEGAAGQAPDVQQQSESGHRSAPSPSPSMTA